MKLAIGTQPVLQWQVEKLVIASISLLTSVCACMHKDYIYMITVEPPNKGHFGASHVVLCREAVLFRNVLVLWGRYSEECPLQKDHPSLGGSFIRGSTACISHTHTHMQLHRLPVKHYLHSESCWHRLNIV